MANASYDAYREAALRALLDGEDVIALLVKSASGYTPNLTTHDFLNDIPGGAILATSDPLTSMTFAAGVFDAADVLFAAVPASGQVDYIVLAIDTGTPSTSRLIGIIDTGTNMPLVPNGGDISLVWSSGTSKIFKL